MGFISSIGQIIKNNEKFKEWEKDDADKKAQREALKSLKNPTPDEFKKAQAKGKVIIDVIDRMDAHSEEISENVETAVMPLAQIATPIISLGTAIANVYWNIKPAVTKFDKATEEFVKNGKGKELDEIGKKIREYAQANPDIAPKARWFEAESHMLMPKMFERFTGAKELRETNDATLKALFEKLEDIKLEYKKLPQLKGFKNSWLLAAGSIIAATVIGFVGVNLGASALQVRASRVARWQSRQDLNDPKYFVQYTDEQVETAKNNLEQKEAQGKKPLFAIFGKKNNKGRKTGLVSGTWGVIKDNKKYNDWKKDYNQEDKKVKNPLSESELIEAKKEKEMIQRVTKEINNKAEEYGENMETAAGVLIGGTPFLGAGIGFLLSWFMNATGISDRSAEKSFNKLLDKASDKFDKENAKKIFEAAKKGYDGDSLIEKIKDMNNNSKLRTMFAEDYAMHSNEKGMKRIMGMLEKMYEGTKTTKKGRAFALTILGGFLTGLVGSLIGLKLQKEASRVGRFTAKREIEQDATNFIGYSEEEYATVGDKKAQKESIGTKLKNYLLFIPKAVSEYFEYEKFKKTEGKQQKELLDELVKSETITDEQLNEAKDLQRKLFTTFENVDDKSQEFSESTEALTEMMAPIIPYIGLAMLFAPLGVGGVRLIKKGVPGAIEDISGFFAKNTRFLKGKASKKYADEVCANLQTLVQNKKVANPADPNSITGFMTSIIGKANIQKEDVAKIIKSIQEGKTIGEILEEKEIKELLDRVPIDEIRSRIEKMSMDLDESLKPFLEMEKVDGELLSGSELEIAKKELLKTKEQIDKLVTVLNNNKGKKLSDIISDILKQDFATIPQGVEGATRKNIADIKIIDFFKGTSELASNNQTMQALSKAIKELKEQAGNGNFSGLGEVLEGIMKGAAKSGKYKEILNDLAKSMPKEIGSIMKNIAHADIEPEQAVNIIDNFAKIAKNMPTEQMNQIFKVAFEEFNKNPEKFLAALKDGSFKSIFITKGVVKASAISGATWTALSLLLTFILESTFASMQKKAGRLGVMTAIEELNDPTYYANEHSKNTVENKETNEKKVEEAVKPTIAPTVASPLLQQYINKK